MDASPGSPRLITDVQFSVVRKGYDPDEVDNFLEKLSEAVGKLQAQLRQSAALADSAEVRVAEAMRAREEAESRLAALQAGSGAAVVPLVNRASEEDAEAASSVLVMAQRTADATVNEARASAAQMIADAEAEASRLLATAQSQADEAFRELERRRATLSADNEALDAFLTEQRAVLAAGVARIQSVLDDPSALRLAPSPVGPPEPGSFVAPASVPPKAETPPSITPPPAAAVAPTVSKSEPVEPPVSSPPTDPSPVVRPAPGHSSSPAMVTAEDLEPSPMFGDAPVEPGPPTEAVSIFDVTEDFLAEGDDADEAMRRFFDADFDDDRFGR